MANSNIMNPYFSQFHAKRLYLKSLFFGLILLVKLSALLFFHPISGRGFRYYSNTCEKV